MCACVLRPGAGSHFTTAGPQICDSQWRTDADTLHNAVKEITGGCSVLNLQKSDAVDYQMQMHVHVQAFTTPAKPVHAQAFTTPAKPLPLQERHANHVPKNDVASAREIPYCPTSSGSDEGSAAPSADLSGGPPRCWSRIKLDSPFYSFIPMPSEDADESESECDDEECDSQEGLPLEKASVVCGFDDAVGACTFQQGPWPWCFYPWTEHNNAFTAWWDDNLVTDDEDAPARRPAATRRYTSSSENSSGVSVVHPPPDPSLVLPWDM